LLPALMPHICFLTSCTVQTLLTRCGVDGISMYSTYTCHPPPPMAVSSSSSRHVHLAMSAIAYLCPPFGPSPFALMPIMPRLSLSLQWHSIPLGYPRTKRGPLTCQVGAQGSPTEMESDTAQKAEDDRRVVGAEIKSRDVIWRRAVQTKFSFVWLMCLPV
jgi:hypothetical protein